MVVCNRMGRALRLMGALVAALVLLGNSACFAACAVESCETQTKAPPCHKHKAPGSTTDSACFARTVIAPIPADAPIEPPVEAAAAEMTIPAMFESPVLAIDAVLAPDPPIPPLILRV